MGILAFMERGLQFEMNAQPDRACGRLKAVKESTRLRLMKRLEVARGFLEDNDHRELCLDEVAAAAGVSKYHLARLFRVVHGQPPMRFHRELRLRRAAEHLCCGTESATAVAERFGFPDAVVFSRAFKRLYARSPARFPEAPKSGGTGVMAGSAVDQA